MNAAKVNTALMLIVGLLVGFIGGYLIGQNNPGGIPSGSVATQTGAVQCPHALAPADRWILAGFRCPGTDSLQAALVDCHCPVAHGIQDRVKSELELGHTGERIRQELMDEYGRRLDFGYVPPSPNGG